MMDLWNDMAADVAMQPLPPELARVVNIACHECELQDDARAWHVHGVQCRHCSSFNTVVDQSVMSGHVAHEFLEAQHEPAEEAITCDPRGVASAGVSLIFCDDLD